MTKTAGDLDGGKTRTAACLYVRDEARDIAEWIGYHLEIGFDHLFIYDNCSRDGTGRVASRFDPASVTVIPWSFTDAHAQYKAYDHCLALSDGVYDWVGCFDIDEFLVFQPGCTLKHVLSDRDDCDAIALHWAFFGSSGHHDYPAELMIEAFTRRAPDDFEPNRHVKSIVRPGRAGKAVTPHSFSTTKYQLPNRRPVTWAANGITATPPDHSLCQLNHYFVRSRAHWADKMHRGYRDGVRPASEFDFYDRNDVDDLRAASIAASVRKRMVAAGSSTGRAIEQSIDAVLFDPAFYFIRYPDVAVSGYAAEGHFWTVGLFEGRDPNPYIDSAWYTRTYLAELDAPGPAYLHFLSIGARRGFTPRECL